MWWVALWIAVPAMGLVGLMASVNSVRFARLVDREVLELWSSSTTAAFDPQRRDPLPAPVGRYLQKALGQRGDPVRSVRLRHGGTFRTSFDGDWLSIKGEHYFATNPPGFVWWGRVRMAPGAWIDARDRSVGGVGNMYVSAESSLTIANSSGPELDQGAMLRLLGEMIWFPTSFLDERHVRWAAIDNRHARAALRVNGREVTGTFEFGEDDLPALFSADRYRDIGGGKAALTPFFGESDNYRIVDGLLLPHRVIASWEVDGRRIPYVRFEVERIELDTSEPFR